MSGVSLAVPHSSLSSDQTAPPPAPPAPATKQKQHHAAAAASASSNSMMGSLRVIELQLVAFILVFSASGLVPLLDLVFPALTSAYILALAKFAFPSHDTISKEEIFKGSRLFRMYVIAGTTIGLFLPLAYVLGGFARGDEHAVRSATPHLFLLSFQILTENIISSLSLFSPPVRALVPMIYTIRRIFVDIDWINDVWINKALRVVSRERIEDRIVARHKKHGTDAPTLSVVAQRATVVACEARGDSLGNVWHWILNPPGRRTITPKITL